MTLHFVSLIPVRQGELDKTVTSCQMYTLVSSTNKTVRQKVNLIKQLLVVRCILYFPQKIKLTTMLCILHDILFKVALKTIKTGHHVMLYTWHLFESGVKHQ